MKQGAEKEQLDLPGNARKDVLALQWSKLLHFGSVTLSMFSVRVQTENESLLRMFNLRGFNEEMAHSCCCCCCC